MKLWNRIQGKEKVFAAFLDKNGDSKTVSTPYTWKECFEEIRETSTPWLLWFGSLSIILTAIFCIIKGD